MPTVDDQLFQVPGFGGASRWRGLGASSQQNPDRYHATETEAPGRSWSGGVRQKSGRPHPRRPVN